MNESLAAAEVAKLAEKYFWWQPIGGAQRPIEREIAQIMHIGTYDDILALETLVDAGDLAQVMLKSAAGWFDDRSWDFWRGRLAVETATEIPEHRPQRTFADAEVL